MDRKKYLVLFVMSTVFLAFLPLNYESHDKIVGIRVHDAYYADLDSDSYEDDIRIVLNVSLIGFTREEVLLGVEYGLLLTLYLPSNTHYSYQYTSTDNSTTFALQVDILHQATESGWYKLRIAGFYKNLDINKPFIESYFQFDPPGGTTGDDPRMVVRRL